MGGRLLNALGLRHAIGIDARPGAYTTIFASAEYLPFRTVSFDLVAAKHRNQNRRALILGFRREYHSLRKGLISSYQGSNDAEHDDF